MLVVIVIEYVHSYFISFFFEAYGRITILLPLKFRCSNMTCFDQ